MDQLNEKLLEDRSPDLNASGSPRGSISQSRDDSDKQSDSGSDREIDLKQIAEDNQIAREQLLTDLQDDFKQNYLRKFQLPIGKFIQVEASPFKQDEMIVVKLVQDAKSDDAVGEQGRTSVVKTDNGLLAVLEFWQINDKTMDKFTLMSQLEIEDPMLREIEVDKQTTHKCLFRSHDQMKLFIVHGEELTLSIIGKGNSVEQEFSLETSEVLNAEFKSWGQLKWADQGWKPDPTIVMKGEEKPILVLSTKKATHTHWQFFEGENPPDYGSGGIIDLDYSTVVFYDLQEKSLIDTIYGGLAFVGMHEDEIQLIVEEKVINQRNDRSDDSVSNILKQIGRKLYLKFYDLGTKLDPIEVLDVKRFRPEQKAKKAVVLATILKNQEKYTFVNEFQDSDKSCILQCRLHGVKDGDFDLGDKLSLFLNAGHDFHIKGRPDYEKVHMEDASDAPEQLKLFGKQYSKQGESDNMWVGKVTRNDLESDIIIPFLNLQEGKIRESVEEARNHVSTSEKLMMVMTENQNDYEAHQVRRSDEDAFKMRPFRAKITDPFYCVDEDSILNGFINDDGKQVRGNFKDERSNLNSVSLRRKHMVHYVCGEMNAYLNPETGVVFVCSDTVMTVWNSRREQYVAKYTKVHDETPFYLYDQKKLNICTLSDPLKSGMTTGEDSKVKELKGLSKYHINMVEADKLKNEKIKIRFLIDDEIRELGEASTLNNQTPRIFFQGGSAYFFKAGTFLASVIYETQNRESKLAFVFGRKVNDWDQEFEERDKMPMQVGIQNWQVEYPLVAYRHHNNSAQQVIFFNMRQNTDRTSLDLSTVHKQFVAFVEADLFRNQTYLNQKSESDTTCCIMLLQDEYDGLLELFVFVNTESGDYKLEKLGDVHDYARKEITQYIKKDDVPYDKRCEANYQSPEKIRCVQILQNEIEGKLERSLIVQYEDGIYRLGVDGTKSSDEGLSSTANKNKETLCPKEDMNKLYMVRGAAKKVFYARRVGKAEKIYMVNHGPLLNEAVENKECFQLTSGKIVAFEPDSSNHVSRFSKSSTALVEQSFYILNDQQMMYHVHSKDETKFRVIRQIDLSQYDLNLKLNDLKQQPWTQVGISNDSITLPDQNFYSTTSEVRGQFKLPEAYVDQESFGDPLDLYRRDDWKLCQMSAEVENGHLIEVVQTSQYESCLFLAQAPDSRTISSLGLRMPCLGRFWLSDNKFIILTKNDQDQVNAVVYDLREQIQLKAHDLCDIIQVNDAGQASLTTSIPKDGMINIAVRTADEELVVFRLDATQADNDIEEISRLDLEEEIVSQKDLQGIQWHYKYGQPAEIQMIHELFSHQDINEENIHLTQNKDGDVIVIGAVVIEEQEPAPVVGTQPDVVEDDSQRIWLNVIECRDSPNVKFIVFQASSVEERDLMLQKEKISYHFIGNHLVWFTESNEDICYIKLFENRDQTLEPTTQAQSYEIKTLDLASLDGFVDEDQILICQVPDYSHFYHKKMNESGELEKHQSLIQITIINNTYVFSLDEERPKEVASIESVDLLMDITKMVNIGVKPQYSLLDEDKDNRLDNYTVEMSPNGLFSFQVHQILQQTEGSQDRDAKVIKQIYSASVQSPFCQINLIELQKIGHAIKKKRRIPEVSEESILCNYNGNTLFSLFSPDNRVLDALVNKFEDLELDDVEDVNGRDSQHPLFRRLYRLLIMPTMDLVDDGNKYRGDVSILRKSLYFKGSRQRECLLKLATMCRESDVQSFIFHLEDITIFLDQMTPGMQDFLTACLVQNKFTDEIDNVKWPETESVKVLGRFDSAANLEESEDALAQGQNEESLQFKEIDTRLIPIQWIYQSLSGKKTGFINFLRILKEVSNDNIYGIEFTGVMIDYIWDFYSSQIRLKIFYPFLLLLVTAHIYFILLVTNSTATGTFDVLSVEFWLRNIVLGLTGLFATLEVFQIIDDKWDYLTDFFNYVNVSSAALNVFICLNYGYNFNIVAPESCCILCAFAVFFLWLNALYWMRFFENTAHYVRMITTTVVDIGYFLFIQFIFMATFGFTLYFINKVRADEMLEDGSGAPEVIDAHFSSAIVNMALNQYLLLLGEFAIDNNDEGSYVVIVWIIFILATFVSQVIIFNMLIAIMGDSYAKISEMREQAALKEKIQILCDYLRIVHDKDDLDTFLVYMKPNEEADEGWGGILSAMKKNIQRAVDQVTKVFNKKFNTLNQDVTEIRAQNVGTNDKLDDVSNSIQKQEISTASQISRVKKDIHTVKETIETHQAATTETLTKILKKLEE